MCLQIVAGLELPFVALRIVESAQPARLGRRFHVGGLRAWGFISELRALGLRVSYRDLYCRGSGS